MKYNGFSAVDSFTAFDKAHDRRIETLAAVMEQPPVVAIALRGAKHASLMRFFPLCICVVED